MNHLATARQRRPHSELPKRELPVLFHLMDVSRPPRASVPAADSLVPAGESLTAALDRAPAAMPFVERPIAESQAAALPPAAPLPSDPVVVSTPSLTETSSVPPPASAAPTKFSLDQPIDLRTTHSELAADSVPVAPAGDLLVNEPPSPAAEHPVTPRPPFETRRKFRTPLSEEWFAAHGRYIAVVFVIALIGTVYLARTSRRPATGPATSTHSVANTSNENRAGLEASAIVVNAGPATNAAPSTPPKLVDTASANSDTRTELHAPTVDESAGTSATDGKSSNADNLFVFPQAKKAEERVAVRQDGPQTIINPTVTSSALAGRPLVGWPFSPPSASTQSLAPAAPAMPSAPTPSLAPAYPTTATPPVIYPPTTSLEHAYPTTAAPPLAAAPSSAPLPRVAPGQPSPYQPVYPTNTFQPPPAAAGPPGWQRPTAQMPTMQGPVAPGTWTPSTPGGWSPPVPGGGPQPQYQPPDNSAPGFRNERTGSGLY